MKTMRRVGTALAALVLAAPFGMALATPATATEAGCGAGSLCVSWEVLGDANYAEVAVTGAFTGNAAMALQQLRLCDEKTDAVAATATVTIAERLRSDGSIRYRNFPDQEYHQGPGAGCKSINPTDYSAPSDQYIWAARADYSYRFGFGAAARTQTYHTGWVYNWYLRDWCPTC